MRAPILSLASRRSVSTPWAWSTEVPKGPHQNYRNANTKNRWRGRKMIDRRLSSSGTSVVFSWQRKVRLRCSAQHFAWRRFQKKRWNQSFAWWQNCTSDVIQRQHLNTFYYFVTLATGDEHKHRSNSVSDDRRTHHPYPILLCTIYPNVRYPKSACSTQQLSGWNPDDDQTRNGVRVLTKTLTRSCADKEDVPVPQRHNSLLKNTVPKAYKCTHAHI